MRPPDCAIARCGATVETVDIEGADPRATGLSPSEKAKLAKAA